MHVRTCISVMQSPREKEELASSTTTGVREAAVISGSSLSEEQQDWDKEADAEEEKGCMSSADSDSDLLASPQKHPKAWKRKWRRNSGKKNTTRSMVRFDEEYK